MQKNYQYNGETYPSAIAVKRAIEREENRRFGPEPSGDLESLQAFWASFGVEYSEEPDPEDEPYKPTLEEAKAQKLGELDRSFMQWYETDATVTSSLGFVADSDARAIMDVTGLVTALEATPEETRSTVAFMDHDNQAHMLTLEQMKTVQLEIIQNGQAAYAQKWTYRSAVESAESVEALEAMTFTFTGEDFSGGADAS